MPAVPLVPLTVTDQMGRRVAVPFPPQRIVSLVPSQTELLFDLGVGSKVVGVTKFCVHPAGARRQATVVGGTKNFHFSEIAALAPDLILGNKEENYREGIEQLAPLFPVWMSDITTLDAALDMIRRVGLVVGRREAAEAMAAEIAQSFSTLGVAPEPVSAAYFIWRKPYMVAAAGTFIDEMLEQVGFTNVFKHCTRYPEIDAAQLVAANPRVVLLSSEPYPFGAKHVAEFQALCPQAQVRVVDGELFSWYGSRLRSAAGYFSTLKEESR